MAPSVLNSRIGFSQLIRAVRTEEEAKKFFLEAKLFKLSSSKCINCGSISLKYKHKTSKLGFKWMCMNKHRCGLLYSPLKGTIFERSHLTFLKCYDIFLHWYFRQKLELTTSDCEISSRTACKWLDILRKVCHWTNKKQAKKIGGPGLFVEVDEAHLFKRKFNRGHRIKGESVWILGGICRDTKARFAIRVKNRKRRVIWRELRRHVAQGTILVTDGFKVYEGVDKALGFAAHEVVVHKKGFVNPFFREVFTNNIECMWGKLKKIVHNFGDNERVDRYISEYLYRSALNDTYGQRHYGDQINQILCDIRKVFQEQKKK